MAREKSTTDLGREMLIQRVIYEHPELKADVLAGLSDEVLLGYIPSSFSGTENFFEGLEVEIATQRHRLHRRDVPGGGGGKLVWFKRKN